MPMDACRRKNPDIASGKRTPDVQMPWEEMRSAMSEIGKLPNSSLRLSSSDLSCLYDCFAN